MVCTNLQIKKYKARNGAPFKQEDAQKIGEIIAKIETKHGKCKPEHLVKEAKTNKTLKKLFIWNKDKALIQCQLQQAREIINHVVEVVVVSGTETEQRSFVSVTSEEESVYVSRDVAIETPDYRKQLMDRMITTLENLTITLKSFKQFDYG